MKPRIHTLVASLLVFISFFPILAAEEPKNSPTIEDTVASSTEPVIVEEDTIPDVEEWKYTQLKRICSCESTGSPYNEPIQFNADGSVLRGRINSDDVGKCQINTYYHQDTADALGIDLLTSEGNLEYAEYLYETQGSDPWLWSVGCWSE